MTYVTNKTIIIIAKKQNATIIIGSDPPSLLLMISVGASCKEGQLILTTFAEVLENASEYVLLGQIMSSSSSPLHPYFVV